jgi:hypothetical protein
VRDFFAPSARELDQMNVLTWHGAVLRVDQTRNRLMQDPLWLTTCDGSDFFLDPDVPLPASLGLGMLSAEPTGRARIVRMRGAGGLLSASPARHELTLELDDGQPWQSFLLISTSDLADLRHLLNHRWRIRPNNLLVDKSAIRLTPGFSMELGPLVLDLPTALPLVSHTRRATAVNAAYSPPPSFVIRPGDDEAESIEMVGGAVQSLAPAQHFELVARRQPPDLVATADLFTRGSFGCLTLPPAAPRYAPPPLVARAADSAMFARFLASQSAQTIGFVGEACQLRREANQYVVLSRGCEGLVFDQDGTTCDMAPLETAHSLPAGIVRRGHGYWVDREVLATAPRLAGPLIVFYGGQLDRFTNWLAGALLSLDTLSRVMPRATRLLLPAYVDRGHHRHHHADLRFSHRETMVQLGFNRLPAVQSDANIVYVDDVIFMDDPTPAAAAPPQLADFRDRALLPYDGPGEPTRRLFIRTEQGGIEERGEVERFLLQQGFEHVELDHLSFEQQIRLFRQASFVVSPHYAGLSNMIFSTPGVKVLEVMDEAAFAPEFWRLSGKLGHVYGFMGCRTVSTPVGRRLAPDVERFRDVFRLLEGFTG